MGSRPPAARTELRPYEALSRRPRFLAPPRRLEADPDAAVLTLHTIQHRDAYETLRTSGTLTGAPALGEVEFAEAYEWMRGQMTRRLEEPVDGILWLWARTTRRDLVRDTKYAKGHVLLTVRLPRQRALLSWFDDWHQVLNRSIEVPMLPGETVDDWYPRFNATWDDWKERSRAYAELPVTQWPADLRRELETSWESIFDLRRSEGGSVHLQATVTRIDAADVVRAVRII